MKKKSTIITLFILSIFLIGNFGCISVGAEENDKYFKFTNITVKDGLSQGSVYAIFKDEDGYMWFGTNDGLNRFNGYDYTVLKSDDRDEKTIPSGIIGSIVEDKEGYLWIGTSSGLGRLDRKSLSVERIDADINDSKKLSNAHVWDLYIDSKDNLWVGTESGLNLYDYKTKEFKKFLPSNTDKNTLSDDFITSISEGENDEIWIGTKDGLNILNRNTGKVTRIPRSILPSNYIIKLYKDSDENMWIATQDGGVVKFNLKTKKLDKLESINKRYGSENFAVNSMYEGSNKNMWLGSKGGLIKYSLDTGKIESFNNNPYDSESLVNDSVQSVYRDDEGLIWIGTYSGISILDTNQRFIHYKSQAGDENTLSNNSIGGIYQDDDGVLWIGTTNDGLNKFDRKNNKMTHYKFDRNNENTIPSNTIFQVTGDKKGNIWVATKEGLCRLNPKTEEIKRYKYEEGENSLVNNDVKEIYFDSKGNLWIGTRDGLCILDTEKDKFTDLTNLLVDNNIGETFIRRVFEDSKGNFWIATGWNGGLIQLDKNKKFVKNYKNIKGDSKSLSNNAIKGINEDKNGYIWVTTSVGIGKLDPKSGEFKTYTEEDGLANNYAYGILVDKDDNLWVSTNGGLSKYDQKEDTFNNYTIIDGIQSNEFNGTAEFKGKDDEMFFGGINGVTAFFPEKLNDDKNIEQKITISKFNVYSNPNIRLNDDKVVLKSNENTFTFDFFLPDYRILGAGTYEYMLEGFDKEWVYSGKRNFARYTNLEPGKYKFKVRARDKNGKLSEVKEVSLKIKKPWYATNIAYFIYFIVLIIIAYFVIDYVNILNKLVKQRTEELNQKMKENKNMYDKLLKYEKVRNTYLVNLSHELRTPLNVILSTEQLITMLNKNLEGVKQVDLEKYMGIIKKNSKNLLKVINDLIDSSKIDSGYYKLNIEEVDIVYLVEETALSMKTYIEDNGLELIIDPEIEEKIIECDKTNIERCVINLISNAVKYNKPSGSIFVSIKENEDSVDIIVKDTGIGIAEDQRDIVFDRFSQVEIDTKNKHHSSGLGLTLVKNLVKLHNGKITLISKLGQGSEFIITLPIKQNKDN